MKTVFIPNRALEAWDALEVDPVKVLGKTVDGEEVCEQVEEGQEDFWSVYVHLVSGGLECIADVETKQQAESLVALIENLVKTKVD